MGWFRRRREKPMPQLDPAGEARFAAAEAKAHAAAAGLERTSLDIVDRAEGPAPDYLSQADRIGIIVDTVVQQQRERNRH